MKWGKQKSTSTPISSSSSSTTSSHFHLISHVIPRSWLSKFKQTSEKTVLKNSPKEMRKPSSEKSSQSPSLRASSQRPSGYYKDEDGFWRLGVGDENVGFAVQTPSCANCKTNVKEVATTTPKKMKKVMPKERVVVVKEGAKQEVLQRTYKKIMAVTKELHKELDEANAYRTQVESWRDLKDAKIREIMSKHEKQQQQQRQQQQRKSFHVSREPNNFKGRVRSPRTPLKTETCKIRALEDMKRMKTMKKKAKQTAAEEAAAFGSFAVVKRSSDPQQDFKESMVEMILEKKIQRPEELEELLACYLTLNSEEYHDVIVKVFRQVWCELEQQSYFMNII